MSNTIRVGILGAGWPGLKHAEGFKACGGFEVTAVADPIAGRRKAVLQTWPKAREFADASELLKDPQVDAVSVCLPNDLHAPLAVAALRAGRHVLCETPPAVSASEARKMSAAATRAGKVLMFAGQRRFGGAEQAAFQAIEKGYVGKPLHARVSWMRTRGVPTGTGWFADPGRSGGGALIDLGSQMLDLGWWLMGRPRPTSVFAAAHRQFTPAATEAETVEDAAFALLRFEGGLSLELSVSWAINQPPRRNGTGCQIHGSEGAIELYTPKGPLLYRKFDAKGEAHESPLKLPKVVSYPAMMRQFRASIRDAAEPSVSPGDAVTLMKMIDAIYASIASGKSASIKTEEVHRGGAEDAEVSAL